MQNTKKKDFKSKRKNNKKNNVSAYAPYNFISLNNSVIEVERPPNFDKFHQNRYNGYITLEIRTKTPLFIKGNGSNFFEVGEKVKIPGSSIRGMIRTLIEIISFGKFHFYDDKKLYFRGLADIKSFREYYSKKMKNVKAGYLIYRDGRYYIRPAKQYKDKTFKWFRDNSKTFHYEKQEDGSWKVWSGIFPGKEKNWHICPPDLETDEIQLTDIDIENYKNDENRTCPIDLLKYARKQHPIIDSSADLSENKNIVFSEGVPIFYIQENDSESSNNIYFGHTRFFRLPYKNTIGDHIPYNLKSETIIDFAESIFGKKGEWLTRVFFEDAELKNNQDNIFLNETSPKILSSPKPTCFQHYLEQSNPSKLKHWDNEDTIIRGYKIYWHRNTPETRNYGWSEGKVEEDNQHVSIKPIREGVIFESKIRFENLLEIELGALLFVLDLPDNCYHKLGMGKPLGLGSIKIKPKLFLIDRKKRYENLFNGDNWQLGLSEANSNSYKEKFEKYILNKISSIYDNIVNINTLWEIPILRSLKSMLNWDNTSQLNWLEKTRYMNIEPQNEFKRRPVLPKPDKILEDFKK
ncbi:MAG: TIGR03986 family type III CRISPR-associated RAMP protein [Promethearchaeota archaeon]